MHTSQPHQGERLNTDMKTFRTYLAESLDSTYPVRIIATHEHGGGEAAGSEFQFTDSDGNDYYVSLSWLARTKERNPLPSMTSVSFTSNDSHVRSTRNQTKSPLKVYSTIGQQIEKFIVIHPTDRIIFAAVHTMTVPVYRLLAQRIAKRLGGRFDEPVNGAFRIILNQP